MADRPHHLQKKSMNFHVMSEGSLEVTDLDLPLLLLDARQALVSLLSAAVPGILQLVEVVG